ncbi:MAG: hypothetical protein P4N60_21930 [Verrucomicrobiae bacterium]|nr:hypothetical protein [Verrucomicrobiae bacterium]
MKSYFLAPIASRSQAVAALSSAMPTQGEPWLLKDTTGDVIAYFNLVEADSTTGLRTISADVSGRHYNKDADVLLILQKLKAKLGGEIGSDA